MQHSAVVATDTFPKFNLKFLLFCITLIPCVLHSYQYIYIMSKVITLRADKETVSLIKHLSQIKGVNESEVIREGIRALERETISEGATPKKKQQRLVGIGSVTTGISDLTTNKKYLAGFGSKK